MGATRPSCTPPSYPSGAERTFSWTAPFTGTFIFDTNGSAFDTVLALTSPTCAELACDDDSGDGLASALTVNLVAGQSVRIVVDSLTSNHSGAFQLTITVGGVCGGHATASAPVTNFTVTCHALGPGARNLDVGDFSGDGVPDVVTDVSTATMGGVQLWRTVGGGFVDAGVLVLEQDDAGFFAPFYDDVVAIDLDSNGLSDIVLVNGDEVQTWLNRGVAGFSGPTRRSLSPTSISSDRAHVGDFNNDCRPDLAIANPNNQGRVSILLNAGDGGFSSVSSFKVGSSTASLTDVSLGDFDHDGLLDVAASNSNETRLIYNQGAGAFVLPDAGTDFRVLPYPRARLETADWNGDDIDDLVLFASSNWGLVPGTPSRQPTGAPLTLPFTASPQAIGFADLNADSRRDVLTVDARTGVLQLQWSLAGTTGPLRTATGTVPRTGVGRLRTADFHRNLKPDVLAITTASSTPAQVCLWSGQ